MWQGGSNREKKKRIFLIILVKTSLGELEGFNHLPHLLKKTQSDEILFQTFLSFECQLPVLQ
jgi:hypothetical protein